VRGLVTLTARLRSSEAAQRLPLAGRALQNPQVNHFHW
jgi:hypothetical protein